MIVHAIKNHLTLKSDREWATDYKILWIYRYKMYNSYDSFALFLYAAFEIHLGYDRITIYTLLCLLWRKNCFL